MIKAASPTLLTSRLRPAIAGDAPALQDCYGDPEVMRHWGEALSNDMKQTTTRLAVSLDIDPAWLLEDEWKARDREMPQPVQGGAAPLHPGTRT